MANISDSINSFLQGYAQTRQVMQENERRRQFQRETIQGRVQERQFRGQQEQEQQEQMLQLLRGLGLEPQGGTVGGVRYGRPKVDVGPEQRAGQSVGLEALKRIKRQEAFGSPLSEMERLYEQVGIEVPFGLGTPEQQLPTTQEALDLYYGRVAEPSVGGAPPDGGLQGLPTPELPSQGQQVGPGLTQRLLGAGPLGRETPPSGAEFLPQGPAGGVAIPEELKAALGDYEDKVEAIKKANPTLDVDGWLNAMMDAFANDTSISINDVINKIDQLYTKAQKGR